MRTFFKNRPPWLHLYCNARCIHGGRFLTHPKNKTKFRRYFFKNMRSMHGSMGAGKLFVLDFHSRRTNCWSPNTISCRTHAGPRQDLLVKINFQWSEFADHYGIGTLCVHHGLLTMLLTTAVSIITYYSCTTVCSLQHPGRHPKASGFDVAEGRI